MNATSQKKLTGKWFIIAAVAILYSAPAAHAYVIDGLVDDWGVDLNAAVSAGYLDTHLPQGAHTINVATEDNADTKSGWKNVGPGWTYGNLFDAEALYVDNDKDNLYVALIQGLPQEGANVNGLLRPGDIGFDVDSTKKQGKYDLPFAIAARDHGNFSAGSLYSVKKWNSAIYKEYEDSSPWDIKRGKLINDDQIEFVYSETPVNGHYVIELSLPLHLLGIDASTSTELRVHWSQECGNDTLDVKADVNPVPEPATMLLLGPAMGLLAMRKRRLKKA